MSVRPVAPSPQTACFTSREVELVTSVALRYVKDDEVARDVAQDALLLAYTHRAEFRGDSRFSTWLYRVAATTALMHLRRERRRRPHASLVDVQELSPSIPAPEASPEDRSIAASQLARCAGRLRERGVDYASVLRLRHVDGCTHEEIAHRLGLKLSTVKNRALRGEQLARTTLGAGE